MKNKFLLLSFGLLMTTQMIISQVPSYVPTNGLAGYWGFNGNANDQSGNSNNGTVNGATLTTDRFGNTNSAYNFDGVNDYIEVQNSQNLNSQTWTISAWINVNGYYFGNVNGNISEGNTIVGKGTDFNSGFYGLGYRSKSLKAVSSFGIGSQPNYTTSQSDITLNNWINVIGSWDGKTMKIYINGKIDDIGLWNRALSQQEITSMYNGVTYSETCNAVSGSLVNGLVGYWPFCGNANDQSGNGNNGVVNGATLTTDRFGNSNGAYEFNMNYIKIDNSNIYNFSDNLSVNVWYKISDNMGAITLNTIFVSKHQSSTLNSSYTLYNENNCGPTVYQTDINGNISYLRNGAFCDTSSWHMLTLTFNKPNMIMYLDGVYYSTISANSIKQTSLPLVFGGTNNSTNPDDIIGRMKGKLDDIGIWNRALTQQEIAQLYNQNQCITNISVTDTLIINVGQLSYSNPIIYANNITIYPNPASTQVNISFNNITNLIGGNINIINSLGQKVATTPITLSGTNTTMALDSWGGAGLYFVQILNAQGKILDIKKIILQ